MKKNFKNGAASFYIVAFSTLILVVIATGFATVILSEISRTANDDLSQSAYDSALAGIEDAKVAYANYRKCKESGATAQRPANSGAVTCGEIIWWVEKDTDETNRCSMVGHILGKIPKDKQTEVTVGGVQKTSGSKETTTNQAYTCVIINTDLKDYRTTLNDKKRIQILRAQMGNGPTNAATKIKIGWYSAAKSKGAKLEKPNYTQLNAANDMVIFPVMGDVKTPPIVEMQIVQTAVEFELEDFDKIDNAHNGTNRATLFLVPNSNANQSKESKNNYIGIYNADKKLNIVKKENVVKTNDHSVMNKAFLTYCDNEPNYEFYCNVEIELPNVYGGGARSNNTFMISITLPYQRPDTDFSVELCDSNGCNSPVKLNEEISTSPDDATIKKISNAQIAIDSTGRANDLYRRVETRLETADTTFGVEHPFYALEALKKAVKKTIKTKKEHNFYIE